MFRIKIKNTLPLNSVTPKRKTQRNAITKINWLMLFREIIVVYSDNHKKTPQMHTMGKTQHY
jgi:hypothetical protein